MHEPVTEETFLKHYQELTAVTKAVRGMLAIDLFQSLDRLPENISTENERDEYRLAVVQRFMDRTRSSSCPDGFPVIVTSEVRKTDRIELTSNDLRGSARLGPFQATYCCFGRPFIPTSSVSWFPVMSW